MFAATTPAGQSIAIGLPDFTVANLSVVNCTFPYPPPATLNVITTIFTPSGIIIQSELPAPDSYPG